jgi:PAS domain S-box-containing protein
MQVEQAPGSVPTHAAPDQTVKQPRRAEQQLAEAQALAHVGSWDWDLVNDRLTWSDEQYRIFGLEPRADPGGVPATLQYIHPEDHAKLQQLAAQALADYKPYSCDFRVLLPDGGERVVKAHARAEVNASGQVTRMHGTVQDVTERRRAEAALQEAEAKYRSLVEHAVEGVFRTTPDGRFLMANRALARMLGYDTADQLLAERPNVERGHYVHSEERARFKRLLDAQGVVLSFDYEGYRRDGSTIWLRDHVRAVRDAQGATLYYEGTVEDVTSRRRAEALLDLRVQQQDQFCRTCLTSIPQPISLS